MNLCAQQVQKDSNTKINESFRKQSNSLKHQLNVNKEKTKENLKSKTSLDSSKKEKLKQSVSFDSSKRQNLKQSLKTKIGIDSNLISENKPVLPDFSKRRELIKTEKDKLKQDGKSLLQEAAKSAGFPNFTKEKPSLGGEFRMESYAANTQNPRQLNEQVYSRFYLTPRVSLFGLPFTTDLYYTTEDNSVYNSNSISLNFDVWAFRDKISEGLKKEIEEKKRLDKMRQYDLSNLDRQKERLQGELDNLISKDELIKQQEKLKNEAEGKLDSEIYKTKGAIENEQKNLKNKLESKANEKKDSLASSQKEKINGDSTLLNKDSIYSAKIEKLDSTKRKKAEQIQKTLVQIEKKQKQLEALRNFDSSKVNLDPRDLDNPDVLISQLDSNSKGAKIIKLVSQVEQFSIGIAYPEYSPYLMYGIPVKGFDMHFNAENTFYGVTVGRGTREDISSFTQVRPEFKRNILAANYGIGEKQGNHIALEIMYARDVLKDLPQGYSPKENKVVSLTGQYKLSKKLDIEAGLATSQYKHNIHLPQTEILIDSVNYTPSYGLKANMAMDLKAIYKPIKNTEIEAVYKKVNPSFYSIGNPFLRRNFREYEVKVKQVFWKNRIHSSVFYKENQDNVMNTSETTNNMKGYGIRVETKFKKYPNLLFLYSPYQQGNNHPDSLLRTQNNLAITTATLTYMKRFKKVNTFTLVNYFTSHMDFSNFEKPVKVRMLTVQEDIQVGARTTYSIGYMKSRTLPLVDSVNSDGFNIGVMYRTSKRITMGLKVNDVEYQNGGYKRGASILTQIKIMKKNTLGIEAGYNKLHKIWELENMNMFFGKVNILFRF